MYVPHLRRTAEAVLERPAPGAPPVPLPGSPRRRGPAQLLRPVADGGHPDRLRRGHGGDGGGHDDEHQDEGRRPARGARHGRQAAALLLALRQSAEQRRGGPGWVGGPCFSDWGRAYWAGLYI